MYIKIVGFKIHIDVEFTFENGTMILLKGESGAGKSTILQAIFWALYGNMRGIYNNMGITKNLSVTLGLPDMVVFRKKNPELLTVKLDKMYEDQVAQSIIDSRYGRKELWKACSYIDQKNRCSLLEGSNKERMEVLNFLSFSRENPKEYIEKINEKLKEVTNEFNLCQNNFITELNIFTKNLEEKPVKKILSEEELEKLRNDVVNLGKEEIQYKELVLEQERIKGTFDYITNSQNGLITELNKLKNKKIHEPEPYIASKEPILSEIQEIIIPSYLHEKTEVPELDENIILTYKEYNLEKTKLDKKLNELYSIISKRENLKKELKEIQEKLEDFSDKEKLELEDIEDIEGLKEEDIWKINSLEKERIKYSEEAKKIGVEYSKDVLEKTLSELKIKLEYLTKLDKNVDNYNKLLNLETKISSLETKLTTDITNIEELEKLEKEKTVLISELKKGLELLSCPNCNISLRYQNKVLVLGEREPVSLNEIKKCENEYEEIRKNLNNLRQILNYEEHISNLDKNIQREEMENFLKNERCKIVSLSNIIKKLENIRYVELPRYSSTFLSQVLSYQKLTRRKKEIEEAIREEIEEDPDLFKQKLNELEEKYKLEQKRIQKNQKLTEEYQKKENVRLKELSKYENLKTEMKEKERQNLSKIEKYKKEEEERFKKYKLQIENIEKEKFLVLQEMKKLEERIKENEKTLKECSFDPNIKKKYEKILEDIQEKKNLISEGEYGSKILKIQNELENKRNVVIDKQNDMTTLNRLKLKAVEIECKQLEDTVNNINTVLETTLPIFFPDPISLKLLLYKKIKTGDRIKPGLNLEITYKGMKYDNINSLSGGEGDRISLALLLALNSVSNSSIILLDECVSSLDGNLKENCIEAIKLIPNKTVICIDHDDGMEGFYDSIVEIKN